MATDTAEQALTIRHEETVDADYEALRSASTRTLLTYFNGKDDSKEMQERAARAQAVLASVTRREATKNARDALTFAMVRSLSTDRAQLEKYINVTMPAHPIVKALPMETKAKED